MSKPQAKRRYRARKAARKRGRHYPFMRGLREWLEKSRGARPILIAAGRRGGKTLLTQEALDRFRHVNWDGPSAWLAKPLAPLPPNTTFTDMERRTLREGQEAPHVDIGPNLDAIKAGLNYPPLCDGLGGGCYLRAGHDGECEDIPF